MNGDFATRLRELRDRHNWTVAEMAYRSGIPKRTLDKYLLREGASLPGFDALVSISRGLGVSIDWLVLGSEIVGDNVELLADQCAREAALPVFEALLKYYRTGEKQIFENDRILGLAPEEWAAEIGVSSGEKAKELVASGVTTENLAMWRHDQKERLVELMHDRAKAMKDAAG